ncbi:porin [Paraburkholderia sediminicola]|uniref:porin n=1 Tax=Paraburkholderia sediminicola TaxID=458836 RepID=UPI0038BC487A
MRKKYLDAAIVAGLSAIVLSANAQSTVTLYGIIDTGPAYISNVGGHRVIESVSGFMQGNRVGFKGREELGGDLAAIFVLENGFDGNAGTLSQGGRLFGRQAFVGLSSGAYGKLTLGRQYDTNYDYMADTGAAKLFAGNGAHVSDNDNLFGTVRFQNAVKYTSPTFGGLAFAAMYAASNAAGAFADNRAYSATIAYRRADLKLALGYLQLNRPNSADNTNGGAGSDYPAPFSLFKTSAVGARTALVDTQRIYDATASCAVGRTQENLVYSHVQYRYLDGSHLRLDNAELNGTWRITPAFSAGLAYIFTIGRYDEINETPKWHQVDLGIDYLLSKRTDLYAFAIYQKAAGSARNAAIFFVQQSSSQTQAEVTFGIRHAF